MIDRLSVCLVGRTFIHADAATSLPIHLPPLFWFAYLEPIQPKGAPEALGILIERQVHYCKVLIFILGKSPEPSTAKLCQFSETKWLVEVPTGLDAMIGWIAKENGAGIMVRSTVMARFYRNSSNQVAVRDVRWLDGSESMLM